jgi:hypothetical protein
MGAVVSKRVIRRSKSYFIFDQEMGMAPDLTVFDPPDLTVVSGILDPHGNPIKYHLAGMDPIGFIHFTDDKEEDDAA